MISPPQKCGDWVGATAVPFISKFDGINKINIKSGT
jgi:hypothetical protein